MRGAGVTPGLGFAAGKLDTLQGLRADEVPRLQLAMADQVGFGSGERGSGGGQVRFGRADRLGQVTGIQLEQHLPGAHGLPGIYRALGNPPAHLEG
ncbi:hypothetical protein D3C78_1300790 [compost metagenome]